MAEQPVSTLPKMDTLRQTVVRRQGMPVHRLLDYSLSRNKVSRLLSKNTPSIAFLFEWSALKACFLSDEGDFRHEA
jgi:hypothetical protein